MEEDKTTHQFKPNSRFEDAVALYNFDIELRDLMFKAVQRLEIALRTKIIQEFSLAHGPFWFFDTSLADDEHKFIENMNFSLTFTKLLYYKFIPLLNNFTMQEKCY